MVIAGSRNMLIVREVTFRRHARGVSCDGASGQCSRGKPPEEHAPYIPAAFHVSSRNARNSAEHRGRDDDADPQNDGAGDNRGGNILVLDDLVVEISRRALVEELVAGNGSNDAYG